MSEAAQAAMLRELAERIGQLRPVAARELVSSGVEPLDRLLPAGGFRRGTLVEWLAECEGSGAGTLVLKAAVQALAAGGALVLIDEPREFYVPAALAQGIELERLIVVQPRRHADALWALEQSLRCAGVAAAVGWIDRLDDRAFRRLQLAAEAGGGLGLLVRPASIRGQPSWAEVRLLVEPLPSRLTEGITEEIIEEPAAAISGSVRRLRIELLFLRGGASGSVLEVELCHETGNVRLAPPVAAPALARRAGTAG